ncbi:MAG TPA: ATP-binding protein [Anaerolineales bacterium]|nr:ATP-binding protein [Anaerolineales bacterium]
MNRHKPSDQPSDTSAIRNYPRLFHRYARLLEVVTGLASTFDLEILLQRTVDAAQELTDSEATSLLLYDPKAHQLYFEAASNLNPGGLGHQAVPAENSIAGWVFTRREPLLVQDALSDPRFFREVDILTSFQTRSVLGVPMYTKDKTLGVIEAVNKREGAFDDEDLRLLEALAAQASVAIENTRLFQQSDVVAEMVHELRSPLTALTAAAYLLQRPGLPDDQRLKLAKSVHDEAQRLNGMTTDFLELARLESGRTRLTRELVELSGLVFETLEVVRPVLEAEQLTLATDIDRGLPPLQGDRNRLKQLLLNLLTNAIKYNQRGGRVEIRLHRQADQAVLEVGDTGRGIPHDSLPHVFERFFRVPDQEARVAGTGLGLAIAKRIAESHRGQIEVASEVGHGTTFTVRLPLAAPPIETRPAR